MGGKALFWLSWQEMNIKVFICSRCQLWHAMFSALLLLQVVTGTDETYDVPSMAELLFGEATTAHNYAAHRLLSEDRTFFKQTNRSPARFQPRPEAEVRSLVMKAEAQAKVRRGANFFGALQMLHSKPSSVNPATTHGSH